jgi:hypothetical protein
MAQSEHSDIIKFISCIFVWRQIPFSCSCCVQSAQTVLLLWSSKRVQTRLTWKLTHKHVWILFILTVDCKYSDPRKICFLHISTEIESFGEPRLSERINGKSTWQQTSTVQRLQHQIPPLHTLLSQFHPAFVTTSSFPIARRTGPLYPIQVHTQPILISWFIILTILSNMC